MYEVYSTTRAGRPLWALAATAGLFVLTTLVAALFAHHKSRQAEINLGAPQAFGALGIRASFPAGWEVGSPERIAQGDIVTAIPEDRGAGRHLFVFRVRSLGPAQLARAAALVRAIQSVDPDAQPVGIQMDPAAGRVGPFQSEIYRLAISSPALGHEVQAAMANVAVTPDRRVLGVLLMSQEGLTARDRRLLEKVSQSISYEAAAPPTAPREQIDGPVDHLEDEEEDLDRKPLVEVKAFSPALLSLQATRC